MFCCRMGAADVETKFVSVERVAEYMRLEGETDGGGSVSRSWPAGEIEFEAVAWQPWHFFAPQASFPDTVQVRVFAKL